MTGMPAAGTRMATSRRSCCRRSGNRLREVALDFQDARLCRRSLEAGAEPVGCGRRLDRSRQFCRSTLCGDDLAKFLVVHRLAIPEETKMAFRGNEELGRAITLGQEPVPLSGQGFQAHV